MSVQLAWRYTTVTRIAGELQDLAIREQRAIYAQVHEGMVKAPAGSGFLVEPMGKREPLIREIVRAMAEDAWP